MSRVIAAGAVPGGAASAGPARLLPVVGGALVGGMAAGRMETALVCLAAAVACGARLRVGWPGRRMVATVGSGVALALVLNLYLNPGTPLAWGHVLGRAPTPQGARYGALLAARMLAGLAAWWVLLRALPGEAAADAATRLLSPLSRLGLPVAPLRASLGLALRFAPLLRIEAARIARVQALRAGGPPRGLRQRVVGAQSVWVPLVVCSLERAERTALALQARHYAARPVESAAAPPRWGWLLLGCGLAAWGVLWRG